VARFVWDTYVAHQPLGFEQTFLSGPDSIGARAPLQSPAQPLALSASNNNKFFMLDGQGTFATLTDGGGGLLYEQISDLFGVTRSSVGSNSIVNPLGYLSLPTDQLTGLVGLGPGQNYDAPSDRTQQPAGSPAGPSYAVALSDPQVPGAATPLTLAPLGIVLGEDKGSLLVRSPTDAVLSPRGGSTPGVIGAPQPPPPPPLFPPPGVDWETWFIYWWSFLK
jgi:hypothetical protein